MNRDLIIGLGKGRLIIAHIHLNAAYCDEKERPKYGMFVLY